MLDLSLTNNRLINLYISKICAALQRTPSGVPMGIVRLDLDRLVNVAQVFS